MRQTSLIIYLLPLLLAGCVTKPSAKRPSQSSSPKGLQANHPKVMKDSLQKLAKEPLTFAGEFRLMQNAVADYKQTEHFKNPQSDLDRLLVDIAQYVAYIPKEKLRELMKEKRFSLMQLRVNRNLNHYEARAAELFQNEEEKPLNLVSQNRGSQAAPLREEAPQADQVQGDMVQEDQDQSDMVQEDKIQEEEAQKEGSVEGLQVEEQSDSSLDSKTLRNAGISLVIMGAIGVLYQPMLLNRSKHPKALVAINFTVSASALVLGALILARSEPSEEAFHAARGFLATTAAINGLIAIYYGVKTWQYTRRYKVAKQLKIKSGKGKPQLLMESIKFKGLAYNTALSAVLSAISIANFSIWTHDLKLSENSNPQKIFMQKIARVFYSFGLLERIGF